MTGNVRFWFRHTVHFEVKLKSPNNWHWSSRIDRIIHRIQIAFINEEVANYCYCAATELPKCRFSKEMLPASDARPPSKALITSFWSLRNKFPICGAIMACIHMYHGWNTHIRVINPFIGLHSIGNICKSNYIWQKNKRTVRMWSAIDKFSIKPSKSIIGND